MPAFEIEVLPPEAPFEPAKFGGVIGVGPAPEPTWIGPSEEVQPAPEGTLPVVEVSPFEPVVGFRKPIAGMPGDPPDDGVLLSLMPRTPPVQERAIQGQPAPSQPVTLQTWPGYYFPAASPYQPTVLLTGAQSRLRTRVYEFMIWPLCVVTEPFRED